MALVILGSFAAGLISWASVSRQRGALVTNLAVRQHLLIQQMVANALELEEVEADSLRHLTALKEAANTFEGTLWVLTEGCQVVDQPDQTLEVPPARSAEIQGQLHEVHHTWDTFRGYLDTIVAETGNAPSFVPAIRAVEQLSPQLMQESEYLVELYEEAAEEEADRLRWLLIAAFAGVTALLVVGFLAAERLFFRPLQRLGMVAQQMGRGDLDTPVEVRGPREIEAMAQSLEAMRLQLRASQQQLGDRAVQLESRVAQHQYELEAAYAFSQNMVTELDTDQLLTSTTGQALSLLQAEAVRLCLQSVDGEDLVWVAESTGPRESIRFQRPDRNKLVIEAMGRSSSPDSLRTCLQCDVAEKDGKGHHIHAELRTGGVVFGTLCALRSDGQRFDPDEERALQLLANSVAIAVANASLLQSERQYAAQMTVMAERERLAAGLHDDLAQTLSFLSLKAGQLEEDIASGHGSEARRELGLMQEALRRAYAQVRTALIDLRRLDPGINGASPQAVSENALSKQLADTLASFREVSGLETALIIADPEALEVPVALQTQVVHVIREGLTNAERHADAQKVSVCVESMDRGERARFTVEDDGVGFDVTATSRENHYGLTIMQERVERSGGQLTVESEPGVGTRITAEFPLKVQGKEQVR